VAPEHPPARITALLQPRRAAYCSGQSSTVLSRRPPSCPAAAHRTRKGPPGAGSAERLDVPLAHGMAQRHPGSRERRSAAGRFWSTSATRASSSSGAHAPAASRWSIALSAIAPATTSCCAASGRSRIFTHAVTRAPAQPSACAAPSSLRPGCSIARTARASSNALSHFRAIDADVVEAPPSVARCHGLAANPLARSGERASRGIQGSGCVGETCP
jgi:hypothetical protein